MIGKITKGRSTYGLLNYILGPGKSDEHREPDIIAGSGQLAPMFARRNGDHDWPKLDIKMLAHQLDRHYKARVELDHHDVRGDSKPSRAERSADRPPHVYHVSLSIAAEEGKLSRDRWAQIARDYVHRMGFDQCEWGAFPHGDSLRGNDHVHLVINLVQRDGSWADTRNDFYRNKRICRELERAYGLNIVQAVRQDRGADRGTRVERGLPGYLTGEDRRRSTDPLPPAEAQQIYEQAAGDRRFTFVSATSTDDGKVRITTRREPQRVTLERLTRIAATAATSETEFVTNLRQMGVWVRPRFAEGGRTSVLGYAVSAEPWPGRDRIWFGGGKLAPDLTLPELRKRWNDTDAARADAVPAWTGKPEQEVPSQPWDERRQQTWERDVLRNLHQAERDWRNLGDDACQSAASDTAGLLGAAAWRLSNQELAAASRDFARNAQGYDGIPSHRAVHHPSVAQAVRLMVRASGPYELTGWLAVLKQIRRLAEATADAHQARGELLQAERANAAMTERLDLLTAHLENQGLSRSEVAELKEAGDLTEAVGSATAPGETPATDRRPTVSRAPDQQRPEERTSRQPRQEP